MKLDCKQFAEVARSDFEFTREFRYLTGKVKLEFGGGEVWVLEFDGGKLADVKDGIAVSDSDCKIVVGGRSDQWDELLQVKPRPFYQCIQSAAVKHQMKISDTNETFAYLPGLNRMTSLLREMKSGRA